MVAAVVHADVDWLTFSTKPGGSTDLLMDIGGELCRLLVEQKGHTAKDGALLGYNGVHCGQLFVGCREDGGLLRISGGTAPYGVTFLEQGGVHGRATRIDYAVTVKFDIDRESYAQETAETLSTSAARSTRGRPSRLELHRGFGGGDTCTIGARSSARYLRLYDKSREQNGEVGPNLWRFEVEYKKPLSEVMLAAYVNAENKESAVMARVRAEFEYQQVTIPWEEGEPIERAKVAVDKTTIERKLAWLREQVAPSIRWLEREGYGVEAREALGLQCPEE